MTTNLRNCILTGLITFAVSMAICLPAGMSIERWRIRRNLERAFSPENVKESMRESMESFRRGIAEGLSPWEESQRSRNESTFIEWHNQ